MPQGPRAPSRFADLDRRPARLWLAAIALLALLLVAAPAPAGDPVSGQADVSMYRAIVEDLRHGGHYYDAAAAALRAGDHPLKPFVAFRLPTLAAVQAALPPPLATTSLVLLALAVFAAWAVRLFAALGRRPPQVIALLSLAIGVSALVRPDLAALHEIWSAACIALGLALWRPGRWVEAAALGLAAMLIRETAAVYVAIMAAAAWREGRRREALGWAATIGVLAIVVALHAHAVAGVVGPLDPRLPIGAEATGPGAFVAALSGTTALDRAPAWLAALLLGLSLAGMAGWRDPVAPRLLALTMAFGVLLSLFGSAGTVYWGLMVAPFCLIGLAFAPDALRDLWTRAWPRRRITVTRGTA